MHQLSVTCPDESATLKVAEKLAATLKGGELIELAGDVGAGKTTFVKGLAKGLGSKDNVSSPSFALKNVYGGRLKLNHFDLYRLDQPGSLNYEISESLDEDDSVTVIEWAAIVATALPKDRIRVEFQIEDKDARKLNISL